jgi:hypothetical protein
LKGKGGKLKILMLPCSMFSLITQVEYIKQNRLNTEEHKIDLMNIMPVKTWNSKGSLLDDINYRLIDNINKLQGKYDLVLISRIDYAVNVIDFVFKNKVDKKSKIVLTDEGSFTLRDLPLTIKYFKKHKVKNTEYFTIFNKQEKKGIKLVRNDLRYLKEKAIKNDYSFGLNKAVIIVGTGLLRKLPMEDIEDYFTNVIDEVIEKFPSNIIVYPFHQITRDSIEQLIENRYKDKIVCKRFNIPLELLVTSENTEAVISTFSTVTSSTNIMFPEIKQYYPDKFDVRKLVYGEEDNVYNGIMITKDYQIKYNNMKPLSSLDI